jgi:hypothetical protein
MNFSFTSNFWRQVDKCARGERIQGSDATKEYLLSLFEHDDLRDIFGYLFIVDD